MALGVILVAVLIVILVVAHRRIYAPFESVRAAVVRYGRGAMDIRAPEDGPTELAEVARGFNAMADHLGRQRQAQLRFLASIAHDLRNPLSALKLATSVRNPSPTEPEHRRAEMIARQIDRLDQMVGDLLDVARVEAGRFDLKPVPQDLRTLVRDAVDLFRSASPIHELRMDLPGTPLVLRCDGTRISQVLNNLLSNAVKYSPKGGIVEVAVHSETHEAMVTVTDPGIGIAVAEQLQIFEPFRRSDAVRGHFGGVGLGLWMSARLVEAHGGRIEVSSVPRVSTTFTVHLPRTALDVVPAAEEARPN